MTVWTQVEYLMIMMLLLGLDTLLWIKLRLLVLYCFNGPSICQ